MSIRVFDRWMLAIALIFVTGLVSFPCRGQNTAPVAGFVQGRYLVEIEEAANSADLENTARNVAALLGGRLEPYASMGFKGFVVIMSPAKLPVLQHLAHVKSVTELTSGGAPPAAVADRPASTTQPTAAPARPVGLVPNAPGSWSSGTYRYDSAGDIGAIGADTYVYDTAGRLVSGTADKERSGIENRQEYSYDGYGNRTFTTTTSPLRCVGGTECASNPGIDSATNRVSGYEYDDAGNVVKIDSAYNYKYDGTGSMVGETFPGGSWQFVYAADGTRIATYSGGAWYWTVRDTKGTVVREYTSTDAETSYGTANWIWIKDYIYRGTRLLAAESPAGRWHFHLDHLGTPRLITGDGGETIAVHSYYPFGAELELLPREGIGEHLKFTGHERDTIAGDVHTLDYMRARYASPFLGSFLSVDPVAGNPSQPQSWNRYAYVRNNPILLADFTGMAPGGDRGGCPQTSGNTSQCVEQQEKQKKKKSSVCGEGCIEITVTADPLPGSNAWDVAEETISTTILDTIELSGVGKQLEGIAQRDPLKIAQGYATEVSWVLPIARGSVAQAPRVFWHGGKQGAAAAAAVAEEIGGQTLESTVVGKALTWMGDNVSRTATRPLWRAASWVYSAGAKGEVVFVQTQAVREGSVWATTELPTLMSNPAVTAIKYIVMH